MSERKVNVAIVDAGGRGAAIIDSYVNSQAPIQFNFLAFPGNDLMAYASRVWPVELHPEVNLQKLDQPTVEHIVEVCLSKGVNYLDVCQDNAVAAGVANLARDISQDTIGHGINVIGHSKEAGILESDKVWCRQLLSKIGLDDFQPRYYPFESAEDGKEFVRSQPDQPWFIKAAGLAEGKGALAARNKAIAIDRIDELKQRFPEAAKRYLVEEWLLNDDGTPGEEFSYFVICKGKGWKFEGAAQDYKTAYDHNQGENTGGMGCVSPPGVLTADVDFQARQILSRLVPAMADEIDPESGKSRELTGELYLSAIKVTRNYRTEIKVVEFNCRPGDPEAQCILPGLKTNRFHLADAINGYRDFSGLRIQHDNLFRVVVTGASLGYPEDYSLVQGKEVLGLEKFLSSPNSSDIKAYGAGVKRTGNRLYASGGRLFNMVGKGKSIVDARNAAYGAMSQVYVEGNNLHYRTDIGYRDMARYYSL